MDKKDKLYKFIKFFLLIIPVITTFLLYKDSDLWYDELYSIGFISKSKTFVESMMTFATYDVCNLPLYSIILFFSYRIFNYTKFSLIFPGIIFALIGLYFLSKIIEKLYGRKVCVIFMFLINFSTLFLSNIVWEIRCYGLLFMLSSLIMYFYLKRLEKENFTNILIVSLLFIAISYTHWFGWILIAMYGLTDLYLIIRKKACFKVLLSYLFTIVLFIPWIYLIINNIEQDISTFWLMVPNIDKIFKTISYLLGADCNQFVILFFFISVSLIFINRKKNKMLDNKINIFLNSFFMIAFSFIVVYIYSKYINPNVPLFLERYFIIVLPQLYIVFLYLFSLILKNDFLVNRIISIVLILVFTILQIINYNNYFKVEFFDYKLLADYLISNDDIGNDDTLIINNTGFYYSGFVEYYFDNKGFEITKNNVNKISIDEAINYNVIYYIYEDDNNDKYSKLLKMNDYKLIDSIYDDKISKYIKN